MERLLMLLPALYTCPNVVPNNFKLALHAEMKEFFNSMCFIIAPDFVSSILAALLAALKRYTNTIAGQMAKKTNIGEDQLLFMLASSAYFVETVVPRLEYQVQFVSDFL